MRDLSSFLSSILLIPALCVVMTGSATAQEAGGFVAGSVTDGSTFRPLAGAQIVVEGTSQGAITDPQGRFRISGLAGGPVTLRVQMIGYKAEEQSASAGATGLVFALQATALELDAVVVTGTAGGSRQREVGNAVARIDASAISELAPVTTTSQLLGGREAGVNILPGSGNIGTGSVVKVRGNSSVSLGNQPLVYVDGIRIDNDSQKGPDIRQGRQVNALDDINPDDIESVEIIKGPAAATLYGTEASGGVIQIITKRGISGASSFEMMVRQGATWLMDPASKLPDSFAIDPATDEIYSVNLYQIEKAAGRDPFQTGHLQSYNLSMRGGSDQVRYFAAAEWEDNEGIVSYNWQEGLSLRGNLSVMPSDVLSVDLNTGYVKGSTRFAQAYTGYDVWGQFVFGNPNGLGAPTRGFLRATPEALESLESMRDNSRFIGGLTMRHEPFPWFGQRLVLGLDHADETNSILIPRTPDGQTNFYGALGAGDRTVERPTVDYTTFDYGATASYPIKSLGAKTSVGAQYYSKRTETAVATGRIFPSPAITSIGGAAVRSADENFLENKSFGMYLQQEIAVRDRVFLTAAVRADDNSAFGAGYDLAIYPKLSAAWVVSDEPFFANVSFVNSLRLRTAWGRAGRQPDAFAALRLYQPATGPNDASVVVPQEIGNPDLGPEVGEEIELGFDASFLDERLALTVTYYDQKTRDAIVRKPSLPSTGFPGAQFVNIGMLRNWGWEVNVDGQLLQTRSLGWNLGLALAHSGNRAEDLGGIPATSSLREGYPFPSSFRRKVVSADIGSNGVATNVMCDGGTGPRGTDMGGAAVACADAPDVYWGQGLPNWEYKLNSTVSIGSNLQLYALAEMQTGHVMNQTDVLYRHYLFCLTEVCNRADNPIVQGHRTIGETWPLGLMDGGFAKLREVSLTYTIPSSISERTPFSRASLTAAGRNLLTLWAATTEIYGDPVADPEMRVPGSDLATHSATIIPPLSNFLLTMRLSF